MFRTVYLCLHIYINKMTSMFYIKEVSNNTHTRIYMNQSYHARAAYDPDHPLLTTSLACGILKTKVHTQGNFQ